MIAMVSGSLILNVEPLPDFGDDFDFAAQFLDVALHDVHADAAAGDGGDFFRGGKPGAKIRARISSRVSDAPAAIDALFDRLR